MSNPHWQRLRLLQPFTWRLGAGLVVMLIAIAIQLSYPKVLAYFIDNINVKHDRAWYANLAMVMFVVIIVQAIATTLRYYLFESTGYLVVAQVRRQLFAAFIRRDIPYFDRHHVAELGSRLSSDVEVLHHTLTMGLAIALRCVAIVVGGVVLLLLLSPKLCAILLGFIPLSLWLTQYAGKHIHHRADQTQSAQADCAKVAQEYLSQIRLVNAFNQQKAALHNYFIATQSSLSIALANTWLLAWFRGLSSLLVFVALLFTLWLGANLIDHGALTIGALTSFVLYASMVTDSMSSLAEFWSDWMRSLGATEKIFAIIESAEPQLAECAAVPALSGSIEFDNVTFAYPGRPYNDALQHISFIVKAGERIAIVGPSGAGKSTIVSLLLGFYTPSKGSIRFDQKYNTLQHRNGIRNHIAVVEQEPALFSGTIFENIAFALNQREASRSEIIAAAKAAYADEFIQRFPQGYDTVVGERGVQLSGGQKQRIAIARALLRNPAILILDEATSALDSASEAEVQKAFEQLMKDRTTIIIAHRHTTIAQADRVLVLEQGRVLQCGTHTELQSQQNGLYRRLMANQIQSPAPLALAP